MPKDTYLVGHYGKTGAVTIADYLSWEKEYDKGWSKKPDFLKRRLFERYIEPVTILNASGYTKQRKNGFYIMAASCLLVETLVSFWRGWETTEPHKDPLTGKWTPGKSGRAFRLFFRAAPRFKSVPARDFYKHVRCGILHQGETTGGWTITRSSKELFDAARKKVDATVFHNELALTIEEYAEGLARSSSVKLRANFDKKMSAVIRNCQ